MQEPTGKVEGKTNTYVQGRRVKLRQFSFSVGTSYIYVRADASKVDPEWNEEVNSFVLILKDKDCVSRFGTNSFLKLSCYNVNLHLNILLLYCTVSN